MKSITNKQQLLTALVFIGAGIVIGAGIYWFYTKLLDEDSRVIYDVPEIIERTIDVTLVDEGHVLYPGTQRKVPIRRFLESYTSYDPSKLTYTTYKPSELNDLGLSFIYPETWRIDASNVGELYIGPPRPIKTAVRSIMGGVPYIKIGRFDENSERYKQFYSFYTSDDMKVVHEAAKVAGLPAEKLTYTRWSHVGEQVAYLIKRGEHVYVLSYETELNISPEFNKILASLKFEEK